MSIEEIRKYLLLGLKTSFDDYLTLLYTQVDELEAALNCEFVDYTTWRLYYAKYLQMLYSGVVEKEFLIKFAKSLKAMEVEYGWNGENIDHENSLAAIETTLTMLGSPTVEEPKALNLTDNTSGKE